MKKKIEFGNHIKVVNTLKEIIGFRQGTPEKLEIDKDYYELAETAEKWIFHLRKKVTK